LQRSADVRALQFAVLYLHVQEIGILAYSTELTYVLLNSQHFISTRNELTPRSVYKDKYRT
jgi:hypothetical protein